MARASISIVWVVVLPLLTFLVLFTAPSHARPHRQRFGRKQRNKGWRRRAQEYETIEGSSTTVTTILVTNPSSLDTTNPSSGGKAGKGKGHEVFYTAEDDSGRTTFVIDCDEMIVRQVEPLDKATSGGKADAPKFGEKDGKVVEKEGKEKALGPPPKEAASKNRIPDDICENVGHGEDGEYQPSGGDLVTEDGETDGQVVAITDGVVDTESIYPEFETIGLYGCEEIAAGNAPTTEPKERVSVTLDVIHEIQQNVADNGSQSILKLMRADLQDKLAPIIADCIAGDGAISSSGRGSGDGSATLITNVNFTGLSGDAAACKQEYQEYANQVGGKCLLTTIPVHLYHDGTDTTDFQQKVQMAIDGHSWDVPGLMKTSTVHRGGTEGSEGDSEGVTAIETEEVKADSETIGPAGYLTIAAAALVLLLLALMLVGRKRRDEMGKHEILEDYGDDDTYLRDMEVYSNGSSPDRVANVVGDDTDSVNTGWTGANTHFRDATAMDAYFANTESRPSHQDVHICSSATCEVCERNRQAGVQFIPSGANLGHISLPPSVPREYITDDTVSL